MGACVGKRVSWLRSWWRPWAVVAGRASPVDAGAPAAPRCDPDAGARDAPAGSDAVDAPPDAPPVVSAGARHIGVPGQGRHGVCTDAPLRLFFDMPPMTGAGGWVQVFDAANPTTPVDSFDIAAPLTFQTIGGRNYFYKPIIISGNEAYIYLRKVLQPGATYYVTIDPGVFTTGFNGPPIGAVADIDHAGGSRSGARRPPPAPARSRSPPTASGDFCTVQGAIDYVPAGNTTPVTINVAAGTYREIVEIPTKHAITMHGEDRNASVISYPNNAHPADPARLDGVDGDEVARDVRRRRQQRPASSRTSRCGTPARSCRPTGSPRRCASRAAPGRSCATRRSRGCRTRC